MHTTKGPRSILVEAATPTADPNHVHFDIANSPQSNGALNGKESGNATPTVKVVDGDDIDGKSDDDSDDNDVTHEVEV